MKNNSELTMRRITSHLAGTVLLLLAAHSSAAPVLTPHIAEYKVKISVLGGTLRTYFAQTDDGYEAQSEIQATGFSRMFANGTIEEYSRFSVIGDTLRPTVYRSNDAISKDGEVVDFQFDWDAARVSGTIDGVDYATELDGLVHDRVSLQYGLMYDLLNGIERAEYFLQDADELKTLSITNIGAEDVKVPYGRFTAIGIQHQAANSSRVTTLWCVEELGYLPVIIEQHRKGKLRLRAVLEEYTTLASTPVDVTTTTE